MPTVAKVTIPGRTIVDFTRTKTLSRSNLSYQLSAMAVVFLAALSATPSMMAQTESVIYSFCSLSKCADGHGPSAVLVRDASGNFYGATEGGGLAEGTVFKFGSDGIETVLYNFGTAVNDGSFPVDGVIIDAQRNLYGTTLYGGSADFGTVYKVSATGNETILHSFAGGPGDGVGPYGPLVRDKSGNLYGTTTQGGLYFFGTIYKLTPQGTETILHNFDPYAHDGQGPITGMTMDQEGNLYGVTIAGGAYNLGAAFEISAKGTYKILYSFGATDTDGNAPATVTLDASDNLYGTTAFGGTSGIGTVFKLTASTNWSETILYSFGSVPSDGDDPLGVPVFDEQGNLYGTTFLGGNAACGTVYRLTPTGEETILHNFGGTGDGCSPDGGLLRDPKGVLYGDTTAGGTGSYTPGGTLYKLVP